MNVTECAHRQPVRAAPRVVTCLVALGVVVLSLGAGPDVPHKAEVRPVCYDCFWRYHDPAFREELVRLYDGYQTSDPLIRADLAYLVSRVEADSNKLCESFRAFEALGSTRLDPWRSLFVAETLAFTAAECDHAPGPYFRRASDAARHVGDTVKAGVYAGMADGSFRPQFAQTTIRKRNEVPADARAFVLGASTIRVDRESKLGVQVERTVRDWLSYQMTHDFSGEPAARNELLDYHEGARVGEIVEGSRARVLVLSGTLAARSGSRWLAADENGLFRFEVLPDKIQYPTTRAHGDLALLVDTHGVSSLVAPALRRGVSLVIGCGDHSSKAEAAYYLARSGVDVYFPCDRFVDELIGYDAAGVLVGSAPVRSTRRGAVIGDRPVEFRIDELVVVQDTKLRGALQYYDTPARYFTRLSELVALRLETVLVDAAGQASRVTGRAEALESTAIGVRVWTEEDYLAVRDWLADSPARRAVLFHSAPYPHGNRLFHEFPEQTTFGDPHPRFLTAEDASRLRGRSSTQAGARAGASSDGDR